MLPDCVSEGGPKSSIDKKELERLLDSVWAVRSFVCSNSLYSVFLIFGSLELMPDWVCVAAGILNSIFPVFPSGNDDT